MYYINFIFLYSVLGFILESSVYKYYKVNEHSSIFTGPYTLVYGFGMLFCNLIYNFLNKFLSLNILTIILYYIVFTITTSLIEFIGGNVIHFFLKIDKWNYSKYKYSFGKYITLKNSLIWGILSLIMIFYFQPYFHKHILLTIPNYFTIIIIIFFLIDLIHLILINKKISY